MASERVPRRVIDGHSHIGELPAWRFYDLKEPVRPTVYDFSSTSEFTGHLDRLGVERALVIPNLLSLYPCQERRVKKCLAAFGAGVSELIRLQHRLLDSVERGYQVYKATPSTVVFGPRWLLSEVERRGVGADRVLFASDEQW